MKNTLGFIFVLITLSGCAVPLLTGIKSIETTEKGTKYEFMSGGDFSIGASGTNRLDNRKGIN